MSNTKAILNLAKKTIHTEAEAIHRLSDFINDEFAKSVNCMLNSKGRIIISGIGNIYANEILFLSNIKPTRKVKSLKDFELKKIIKNSKKILEKAIRFGGASIKDFSSSNGKKGSFQQHFSVYGKDRQVCSNINCKNKIVRSVISNRATFFCLKCQK